MTKTEAANEIALQVIADLKRTKRQDGKAVIAEVLSDCSGGHRGGWLRQAADLTTPRAVYMAARRMIKADLAAS